MLVMPTKTMVIDAAYAPEMVEFWSQKYKDIKEEYNAAVQSRDTALRSLKDLKSQMAEIESALKVSIELGKVSSKENATLREKISRHDLEKAQLEARLQTSEAERALAAKQVNALYLPAKCLAAEAAKNRAVLLLQKLAPPPRFLNPDFKPHVFSFPTLGKAIESIPTTLTMRRIFASLEATPFPPSVAAPGQHGHWFYPILVGRPGHYIPQEIFSEYRPNEWIYIGTYELEPFEAGDLKLCEWILLDEQVKHNQCLRVARNTTHPGSQPATLTQTAIHVRRRYDTGEWSLPCFSLKCIGFNQALYDALLEKIKTTRPPATSSATISTTPTTAPPPLTSSTNPISTFTTIDTSPTPPPTSATNPISSITVASSSGTPSTTPPLRTKIKQEDFADARSTSDSGRPKKKPRKGMSDEDLQIFRNRISQSFQPQPSHAGPTNSSASIQAPNRTSNATTSVATVVPSSLIQSNTTT